MAVVNAFHRAFRAKGYPRPTHLILKTMNADVVPDTAQAIRSAPR
jgi:hypothetical protein